MKVFLTLLATLAAGVTALVLAQEPERRPTWFWPAAELKKIEVSELVPKTRSIAMGIAAKTLLTSPTHAILLASREKSFPEVHLYDNDVFVVQAGEGTLQVGGELVDRKEMGPGQLTGSAIRGAQMHKAAVGDVLYIPKNTPHMWHLVPGKTLTYLVVKITDKP